MSMFSSVAIFKPFVLHEHVQQCGNIKPFVYMSMFSSVAIFNLLFYMSMFSSVAISNLLFT